MLLPSKLNYLWSDTVMKKYGVAIVVAMYFIVVNGSHDQKKTGITKKQNPNFARVLGTYDSSRQSPDNQGKMGGLLKAASHRPYNKPSVQRSIDARAHITVVPENNSSTSNSSSQYISTQNNVSESQ
jgi:hypothetical protein